jgi:hypothetical protein
MKKLILLFLFLGNLLFAQQGNLPLNDQWMTESEAKMVESKGFLLPTQLLGYDSDTTLHVLVTNLDSLKPLEDPAVVSWPLQTSLRPLMEQGHPLRQSYSMHNNNGTRLPVNLNLGKDPGRHGPAWIRRKKFQHGIKKYHSQNSLLQVEQPAKGDVPLFRLYIDPMLNLQYSKLMSDTSSEMLYINSRGVTARGDIGTKVSFETSFMENQAFLPAYQDSFALKYKVIPGMGRWKKFKTTGYDYAMASGMISWSLCRYFNIQVGHGKHFVGDGVRSLLLSDNAFNYPYARFTGWIGQNKNIQYSVIYASLMNLEYSSVAPPAGTEPLFKKKSAVFHHISWKFLRTFEVSVFQGGIYKQVNDSNRQNLDFWYFNPLIGASAIANKLNNDNNYLIGATFRADIYRMFTLYGQVMFDEFNSNDASNPGKLKYGYQIGAKYFNAFTVKHLHLRVEYNTVNPYSYATGSPEYSWSHYNQALAHPLGANFKELNASLYYKIGSFFLNVNYFTARANADIGLVNAGQNIFNSDVPMYPGPGVPATLSTLDVHAGWMISYASNLNVAVGYKSRNLDVNGNQTSTSFVYVALRTSLTNANFDLF